MKYRRGQPDNSSFLTHLVLSLHQKVQGERFWAQTANQYCVGTVKAKERSTVQCCFLHLVLSLHQEVHAERLRARTVPLRECGVAHQDLPEGDPRRPAQLGNLQTPRGADNKSIVQCYVTLYCTQNIVHNACVGSRACAGHYSVLASLCTKYSKHSTVYTVLSGADSDYSTLLLFKTTVPSCRRLWRAR